METKTRISALWTLYNETFETLVKREVVLATLQRIPKDLVLKDELTDPITGTVAIKAQRAGDQVPVVEREVQILKTRLEVITEQIKHEDEQNNVAKPNEESKGTATGGLQS